MKPSTTPDDAALDTSPELKDVDVASLNPDSPSTSHKRHLTFVWISIAIIALILSLPLLIGYWYFSSFAQAANTSPDQLFSTIKQGLTNTKAPESPINFLILGIDQIVGQKDDSQLTDTMIFASFNQQTNTIHLLSLPRDLWIEAYKTKINSLYYYGEKNPDTTGIEFTNQIVSQILDQPIDFSIVINLNLLEQVINTLGHVEIDVPASFTDTQFPRDDIELLSDQDPEDLYETVSFQAGIQKMNGDTALKYIRSRHSQDRDVGNDLSRNYRQQQLIHALIQRISQWDTIKNPRTTGSLFQLYQQHIDQYLPLTQLLAIARSNPKKPPTIESLSLSADPQNPDSLLLHPPSHSSTQWVYLPADPSWRGIQDYIQTQLDSSIDTKAR